MAREKEDERKCRQRGKNSSSSRILFQAQGLLCRASGDYYYLTISQFVAIVCPSNNLSNLSQLTILSQPPLPVIIFLSVSLSAGCSIYVLGARLASISVGSAVVCLFVCCLSVWLASWLAGWPVGRLFFSQQQSSNSGRFNKQ